MTRKPQITVLKFGSSVLRNVSDLPTVVHEIYRHWREGSQVIAVVSAFGDTTDSLVQQAESVSSSPDRSALAMLLATGEAASSAFLGLALNKSGIPVRVLDAAQAGLHTVGSRLDSDLVSVDSARLLDESEHAVVVLPGFVGRGEGGDTTLLGRGGSDLTALFLAHRLNARCVLVKDVDGLYTGDPNEPGSQALRYSEVSYTTAARVGGSVVQTKAVRFAEAHKLAFSVSSIASALATHVGPFPDVIDNSNKTLQPLRVALFGCGTVGGGVYQRLAALPDYFSVVGVGVRNRDRALGAGVAAELITTDLDELIERPCDVVIELMGGVEQAAHIVNKALGLGRHVVTANKALVARDGTGLEALAEETGGTLRFSAAVGGVLPALEAIANTRAVGPLRKFSGVINSTTNFVLDHWSAGATLADSVKLAQQEGYAEADPTLDLDGSDAAQKLLLLARAGFDPLFPWTAIQREGIEHLDEKDLKAARERGAVVRLVAECCRDGATLRASVKPTELPATHPLAHVNGIENRLLIEPEIGEPIVVSGTGAGRWPTTEAVLADLFELRRELHLLALGRQSEEREECVA